MSAFTNYTGAKLIWTSAYNCYQATVKGFKLEVNWHSEGQGKAAGYQVIVAGRTLTRLSPTVEEGKQRAVRYAVQLFTEALVGLE